MPDNVIGIDGEPFNSEPWDQRQPFDGTALYCVLCNYLHDVVAGAQVVIDGYSLCAEHGTNVMKRAKWIWFDTSDRFHLRATIQNNKEVPGNA